MYPNTGLQFYKQIDLQRIQVNNAIIVLIKI